MDINTALPALIGAVWDTNGNKSSATVTNWGYPFDGQCVSLCKAYFKMLYGSPLNFGNAIDYYNNMHTNGILNYCDWITSNPKNGDIAVMHCVLFVDGEWKDFGHVMIYYNGQYISQNVDMGNGPIPKACVYPNYWSGQIIGWFRPRVKASSKPAATNNSDWQDTIVHVGDTVKSIPLSFTELTDDKEYANIPALGGFVPLTDITDMDGDGFLSNTSELVYLDPCEVEAINSTKNLVKVHGYWVNATPLLVKVK